MKCALVGTDPRKNLTHTLMKKTFKIQKAATPKTSQNAISDLTQMLSDLKIGTEGIQMETMLISAITRY